MSVLKMKFVSIVGLKDYFDDFVFKHIIDSNIQLESALNFLENIKGLSPFPADNPYYDLMSQSSSLITEMGLEKEINGKALYHGACMTSPDEIRNELAALDRELKEHMDYRSSIREQLKKCIHMQKQLEMLTSLDVDIDSFFNFEFIKFRFGRMPKKTYLQLQLYMDELEAIVTTVSQDEDYVWLIYFSPRKYSEKVDGIFSSLYFERIRISGEIRGNPTEALAQLKDKIAGLKSEQKRLDELVKNLIEANREKAVCLYYSSVRLNRASEVRKYACHTAESFYLIGWMPEEDLKALMPILDKDKKIIYIQEEPNLIKSIRPPTEIRNNSIIRPFETLVRMYGLPSYNEIDPTAFVAITYFIMFGLMFGDVGQGFVLFAGGILLMKMKIALGGVILGAGLSSVIFGFFYGSVFGFEDWMKPMIISPMHNINTMLVIGVSIGVVFISAAMLLNIINGIKSRNLIRILLDRNGVAGFVFFWGVISSAVFLLKSKELILPVGVVAAILALSLLAMFVKEPVENLVHRKKIFPNGKSVFFVQTFFEMFDTVLSFISNTVSFIRLSAFALNHAGLFMAVLILADMMKGPGGIVAVIVGNILIVGLEGLIVGIQALRLEYYELFSRFFTGEGRPYKPLKNQYYL
ncbi:MAG: V-type ATP synthase subunit I [Clostridia bacterium]|nr:V-type ATP synthase subunit I [Clostridia bacterium]